MAVWTSHAGCVSIFAWELHVTVLTSSVALFSIHFYLHTMTHELPFCIFPCEFSEYSSGGMDTNTGCIYYSAPSTMRGVRRDFDFADSRKKEPNINETSLMIVNIDSII